MDLLFEPVLFSDFVVPFELLMVDQHFALWMIVITNVVNVWLNLKLIVGEFVFEIGCVLYVSVCSVLVYVTEDFGYVTCNVRSVRC